MLLEREKLKTYNVRRIEAHLWYLVFFFWIVLHPKYMLNFCVIFNSLIFHFEILCKLAFSPLLFVVVTWTEDNHKTMVGLHCKVFYWSIFLLCWVNVQTVKKYYLPKTLVIFFFSKLVFLFILLVQNSGLYIIACLTLFSLSAVFLVGQLLVCVSTNDKLALACNVYLSKIHRLFVCLTTTEQKPFRFKQNNIKLFQFVTYT